MKLWLLGLGALFLCIWSFPVRAGGPLNTWNGAAVTYSSAIPYNFLYFSIETPPQNPINEASQLVDDAFAVWSSVSTANVSFQKDVVLEISEGDADKKIEAALDLLKNTSDQKSPVIWDKDGDLIKRLFGIGAEDNIKGFAASEYSQETGKYTEGIAVFNGKIADKAVVIHEIGHFIGLDHSQIQLNMVLDGNAVNDHNIPTMIPILDTDNSSELESLHPDDVSAVTELYPTTSLESDTNYGKIRGTLVDEAGRGIKGANIVAIRADENGFDPLERFSTVSDYYQTGIGAFEIRVPPGEYRLAIERIDSRLTGGSAVGPYADDLNGLSFTRPVAAFEYPFAVAVEAGKIAEVNQVTATLDSGITPKITLSAGWNMVSLPINANDIELPSKFKVPGVRYIWEWDTFLNAGSGNWRVYPQVGAFEELTELKPHKGYWFLTNQEVTLEGLTSTSEVYDLAEGWNLVGVRPGQIPIPIESFFRPENFVDSQGNPVSEENAPVNTVWYFNQKQLGRLMLTEESLDQLKGDGLSEDTVGKLELLKDREFDTESDFLTAIEGQLGSETTNTHKNAIITHARNLGWQVWKPEEEPVEVGGIKFPLLELLQPGTSVWVHTKQAVRFEYSNNMADLSSTSQQISLGEDTGGNYRFAVADIPIGSSSRKARLLISGLTGLTRGAVIQVNSVTSLDKLKEFLKKERRVTESQAETIVGALQGKGVVLGGIQTKLYSRTMRRLGDYTALAGFNGKISPLLTTFLVEDLTTVLKEVKTDNSHHIKTFYLDTTNEWSEGQIANIVGGLDEMNRPLPPEPDEDNPSADTIRQERAQLKAFKEANASNFQVGCRPYHFRRMRGDLGVCPGIEPGEGNESGRVATVDQLYPVIAFVKVDGPAPTPGVVECGNDDVVEIPDIKLNQCIRNHSPIKEELTAEQSILKKHACRVTTLDCSSNFVITQTSLDELNQRANNFTEPDKTNFSNVLTKLEALKDQPYTSQEELTNAALNAIGTDEDSLLAFDKYRSLILRYANDGIQRLDGLEWFTNLDSLSLENNRIETIDNLRMLVNLDTLDLRRNNITHVRSLSHLTQLTNLSILGNEFDAESGIGDLSSLKELTLIDLRGSGLKDVGNLSELTKLKILLLEDNQLSDIGDLSNLTELEFLDLEANQFSNVGDLSGLTKLVFLDLGSNQLSNQKPASGLSSNARLQSTNTSFNVGDLSQLKQLKFLDLRGNELQYVGHLDELVDLEYLVLSNNQLTDIGDLSKLTQLKTLALQRNKLTNIGNVGALTNLEILFLGSNDEKYVGENCGLASMGTIYKDSSTVSGKYDLNDITYALYENYLPTELEIKKELFPEYIAAMTNRNEFVNLGDLSQLTNLRHLNLQGLGLEQVTGIPSLTKLEQLCLGNNYLESIGDLNTLVNLKTLDLAINSLTDIGKLDDLTELHTLIIYMNQLSDIGKLDNLTKLRYARVDYNNLTNANASEGIGSLENALNTLNTLIISQSSNKISVNGYPGSWSECLIDFLPVNFTTEQCTLTDQSNQTWRNPACQKVQPECFYFMLEEGQKNSISCQSLGNSYPPLAQEIGCEP